MTRSCFFEPAVTWTTRNGSSKNKTTEERDTRVESIQICDNRAVVTAIVAMTLGDERAEFHNIRIFLRTPDGKLFAQANPRVPRGRREK